MSATDGGGERVLTAALAAAFAAVAALAGVDLASDLHAGTTLVHVGLEGGMALIGLGGVAWMSLRFRALSGRARRLVGQTEDLSQRLEAARKLGEQWRREAAELISGLSSAIDRQLDAWGLTPAEKEIALLLLKGLSHKEIGELRKVGEATVRQQAGSIYRKAQLEGRADLAAYFLEDLLVPREPRATLAAHDREP